VKTVWLKTLLLIVRNKCSFCCHLKETYVKTKKKRFHRKINAKARFETLRFKFFSLIEPRRHMCNFRLYLRMDRLVLYRVESTEYSRASTAVYTHEYPITLPMVVGLGQKSRLNTSCLPVVNVDNHSWRF